MYVTVGFAEYRVSDADGPHYIQWIPTLHRVHILLRGVKRILQGNNYIRSVCMYVCMYMHIIYYICIRGSYDDSMYMYSMYVCTVCMYSMYVCD